MPIYAYRCASCGHAQDVLQKLSDPVLTVCPSCGAQAYQKQVTAAGFQLKGSGWYVTDFRGGNNGAPKKEGEAVEPTATDSKPGDSPDAKAPDAKSVTPGAEKKSHDAAVPASGGAPASKADKPTATPASPPAAPAAGSGT
jgi:putative FmdB family regulatory protein